MVDSVARAVLGTLHAAGVRTAFGIPGVHNLAFWRPGDGPAPELVGVRHEQTTVYAADGLARAGGGLGVALTTTGPGTANAVAAFGEAAACGSPVLLIASEIATGLARSGVLRGVLHESRDQAALFEPLAKAVFRPRTPTAAVAAVAAAAELAMTAPRGPVYVDIPTDVLAAPAAPVAVRAVPPRAPSSADVAAATALLAASERIVIWAGGGVIAGDACAELAAFATALRAPVVTTFAGRGALPPDHPCAVGLPPHEREVADLIGGADLLVAVGTGFDGPNTRNWTMPRPPALLSINIDPDDLGKNYPPTASVLADAKLALPALTPSVPRPSGPISALPSLRATVRSRLAVENPPAVALLSALDAVVEEHDPVVVCDMAIPGYWYGGYGRIRGPRRLQYPIGWGTLGYALPAAVGAGALRDRPVLAVCGDGGFMFGVGELSVLAQEQLPVTVLIVDDGGYGMLRFDQDHAGDEHRGVDLHRPDFATLANAFSIPAVVLDSPSDVERALAAAVAARTPQLVILNAALTPPRTTSPRWNDPYA
jgi:thiamine pyrophosphate-dependent acetolactate synthase large subunit-like protein